MLVFSVTPGNTYSALLPVLSLSHLVLWCSLILVSVCKLGGDLLLTQDGRLPPSSVAMLLTFLRF